MAATACAGTGEITVKRSDLIIEVTAIIEARISAGDTVAKPWLMHEVLGSHVMPKCDDEDWFLCCAREALDSVIRFVVQRYRPTENPDAQTSFPGPGFVRLQRGYAVERDGEQCIVPTLQLSDDEIDAKAAELRRMGEGCFMHADELMRFKAERRIEVSLVAKR